MVRSATVSPRERYIVKSAAAIDSKTKSREEVPAGENLVSVIFTLRNEIAAIQPLLAAIRTDVLAGSKERYELIFVDDCSNDGSYKALHDEAARLMAEDPPALVAIRLIQTSRRFGVENCLVGGLRLARGKAAIFMYSDLQDPLSLIPRMVASWRSSYDVVHTRRRRRIGDPLLRRVASALAYRAIQWLGPRYYEWPADCGDVKLMSRRVIEHLLPIATDTPYLRGLVSSIGFPSAIIDYDMIPRQHGIRKNNHFGVKTFSVADSTRQCIEI